MEKTVTSYTLKGAFVAQAPITVSYVGQDQRIPRTPHGQAFLNGGTLRGPLRKAALQLVLREVVKEKGLTLAEMYMLGEGVDITRGVNNEDTSKAHDPVAVQRLREINPFLDLMGRWKLAGRLEVHPLLTAEANVMQAGQGVRHDQFERDPGLVEWLSEEDRNALLETLESAHQSRGGIEAVRDEIKKLKKAYRHEEDDEKRREIGNSLNQLQADEKAIKEERKGSQESIQHPIEGYQAIAPGSELSSTLRITSGTPVHLGLLLRTLGVFSETSRLGGHAAIGFGQVSGQWTVYRRDAGALRATEIGEVRLDDLGIELSGDELHAACEAFSEAIPHMDPTAILLSHVTDKRGA